jgi:predicted RNase H-like nuclease (RuvC/YqgF family)
MSVPPDEFGRIKEALRKDVRDAMYILTKTDNEVEELRKQNESVREEIHALKEENERLNVQRVEIKRKLEYLSKVGILAKSAMAELEKIESIK